MDQYWYADWVLGTSILHAPVSAACSDVRIGLPPTWCCDPYVQKRQGQSTTRTKWRTRGEMRLIKSINQIKLKHPAIIC